MGERDEDAKGLGEAIKKVFAAGVTAAFVTEESLRQYLGDLKLPKEILQMLLSQAQKSKDELVQRVSKEIIQQFQKIDMVQEMSKFAENHKFKITAEIEIEKKAKPSKTPQHQPKQ